MENYRDVSTLLLGCSGVEDDPQLVSLRSALMIEIKKARWEFEHNTRGTPLTAFCYEKISPAVRARLGALKAVLDERLKVACSV